MRIWATSVVILVLGCSEPTLPQLTLQEKWAKVQSLKVEDATIEDLTSKLGYPYRSDDGEIQRSRFWYPFEGLTSTNTRATAPMLIVIMGDGEMITSYLRSEPVVAPDGETHIVPHEYKTKINGKWKKRDLKTGKVLGD
jgi:hypothetical protein